MKIFAPQPDKNLFQLSLFWWVIGIFVALAIFFIIAIAVYSNLVYSFEEQNLNSLLSAFKLPLGILAVIIPGIALVASYHRSVQTAEQIQLTATQNNLSNYNQHIKEFEDYAHTINIFDAQQNRFPLQIKKLHQLLFPKSLQGEYSIDENFLTRVDANFKEVYQSLNLQDCSEEIHSHADVKKIMDKAFDDIFSPHHDFLRELFKYSNSNNPQNFYAYNAKGVAYTIIKILQFYIETSVIPDSLQKVANYDYSVLPTKFPI